MNSKIVFGQYYNSNSWVHRLDPRSKIISVIVLMVFIFLINNIYYLLGLFGLTIILLFTTKIPFTKFLKSIKMLSYLLFITFIFQVLFRKDSTTDPLVTFELTLTVYNLIIGIVLLVLYFLSGKIIKKFRFPLFVLIFFGIFALQYYFKSGIVIVEYPIKIYEVALRSSLFLIVRLITLIFISSVLTLTTKPTELNLGLERLLKPFNIFYKYLSSIVSMMISIALRFIPTLINEANKILKAQASRGVDFTEGNMASRIKQIVSLIVPMFVISYKRALDLSDAMDARGYNPEAKRTSINVIKLRYPDIIIFIFLVIFMVFIILGKIFLGI